jgi:hypothetical protein
MEKITLITVKEGKNMNKKSVHAAQVVELGKVTVLTLGDGHRTVESNWRSRGGGVLGFNEKKSVITVVELGSAASLTLGGMGTQVERNRPNSQYSRPTKQ